MLMAMGMMLRNNAALPFVGALDTIPASAAAYSTRRLLSSYTGPAIRVRRSSDNAEADIGFTAAGDLDTTALLAHVGAGNGFVTTWYDQSGNGRNATQTTAGNQPHIVNAGVVETLGGKPAIVFNGTNNILVHNAAFLYQAGAASVSAVLSGGSQADRRIVAEGSSSSFQPVYSPLQVHLLNDTASSPFIRTDASLITLSNLNQLTSNSFNGSANVLTHVDTGSSFSGFLNGAAGESVGYTRGGTLTMDRFAVGGLQRPSAASFFNGFLAEIVTYPSSLSTSDRQTLERNQGAYYGITVA